MIRLFEGKHHIDLYRKYRPVTPALVISKILKYMSNSTGQDPPYGTAVDVGCGTGQHTLALAPHFSKVFAYDISPAQIEAASEDPAKPENVSYAVSKAETLTDLKDDSVDLVTGCLAFHWLDLPAFYKEVDRVLRPGGTVAAIGHLPRGVSHLTKSEILGQLMDSLVSQHLHPRYHEKLTLVDNGYRDLPMPYPGEVRLRGLMDEVAQTVAYLTGYYSTWSCFQTMHKEDPQRALALLENFQDNFLKTMGVSTSAKDTPLVLRNEYFLVMCQKPPA